MTLPPAIQASRTRLASLLAIVGCAAILRLAAAANDLWFDEIWSLWLIARETKVPWDLFRGGMRHDNNHLLNSLYLFWLPPHLPPLAYRLASVAAGTASVGVAWLLGSQRSAASGRWCAIAVATSHMLVNCSSEARGYGLMSLFLLIAQWAALERFEGVRRDTSISPIRLQWLPVIFGGACILGLLAHLTFVMGYLAILFWTAWITLRQPATLRTGLRTLLAWHTVPLVFTGLLWLGFVRGMAYGKGPEQTLLVTATKGLAALAGATQRLPWTALAAAGVACVAAWCLARCFHDRPQRAAFFVTAIMVAPAAVLAAFPIDFYSVRYLLAPLQTLLILLASELAVIATSAGRIWPGVAVAVGLVACGANLARDAVLIHRGRGQYRRALAIVKEATAQNAPPLIAVGSNHDLRTELLVAYHQQGLPGRPIRVLREGEMSAAGADWVLLNHLEDDDVAAPSITDAPGNRYELVFSTRSGGLSETHWHLYRRRKIKPQ